MLQKQKLTSLIRTFVTKVATPAAYRGAVLFVSMGLVGVSINARVVAANHYTAPHHITVAVARPKPKEPVPVVPAPAPVPAPTPAPAPAPKVVIVTIPKTVISTPTSSVSTLKPTSSTAPTTTSTSTSSTSTSSSSSSTQQAASYSSTNWAGYMAGTGVFTGVSASWVVPNVSGNGQTTTADGTWIGIGGISSGDLIQTGTQDVVSASGAVSTATFYELLPNAAVTIRNIAVAPGDSMIATITEISSGTWTISITDNTDNESFTTTVSYNSSQSSAEWIEEDPSYSNGTQVPLDTFGSVTFSGATATVNSASVVLSSINASSITLVSSTGQALAVPSAISTASNGFTVTQQ